ncbi:MAG: formylglycine-generating enzyme family protein [Zoogloeaceae bacterium]|nr:formylglycine-generating enzyme family protein [Zoogloeaceae bacterium]
MTRNRKIRNILMTLLFGGLLFACSDSGKEPAQPDVVTQQSTRVESTFDATTMNNIGVEFVLIPAGEFMMGCGVNDFACEDNEKPQHRVKINHPFYLGKYEVTQSEWEIVMPENPSRFKGDTRPVDNVSWNDIQIFIKRLNDMEGTQKYRLPTEEEWEYAARAGTSGAYHFGDDVSNLGRYAWYEGNSGGRSHPVGQKQVNPWGLYDMHGNAWEWVADAYNANYDVRGSNAQSGKSLPRVLRGGSWNINSWSLRAAFRIGSQPDMRDGVYGFRLAFTPTPT